WTTRVSSFTSLPLWATEGRHASAAYEVPWPAPRAAGGRRHDLLVLGFMKAEERRLSDSRHRVVHWKRWGPYLSERAWGTVGEDYSEKGTAWEYFPHDHAR